VHRVVRILVVVALAAGIALACRHLDVHALGAALRDAAPVPFAIAIALNLVARTAVRARRTQLLLAERVPFRALVRLNLAGYAASSVLPGPAEEVVTCTQLAKQRGFSARELVRFQLTDKSLGALSMGLVALALLPAWLALAIGGAVIAMIAIVQRRLLVPLGWLVVSNLLCVAMIALCLTAVGASATPVECVQLFFATSLTSALSLVPGQVGTFESAFALVAMHQGLPPSLGLAAAVLYHVAQVVPPAIAGLPELCRMSWETGTWTRA
jgi:uncharacterized membrane protein YbhN (UPF0104 family)